MDAGLHGTLRYFKNLRGVAVGQSLGFDDEESDSLILRQRGERLFDVEAGSRVGG